MTVEKNEPRSKRSGTRTRESPAAEKLTLTWSLAELPSAQHRAGLAGLVLMVRWLARRPGSGEGTCTLVHVDERSATLEMDKAGLRRLLDETYAATTEQQEEAQPRKNKAREIIPPLEEREKTITDDKGRTKTRKVYVYPVVVPKAAMLVDRDPTAEGDRGLWVKLWRDMVWSTLRGKPATREPFEARAEGRAADDVDKVWKQLQQPLAESVDLSSTYFLGAQASTAENVPFKDRARYQFLLHFWPYAAQVYVPEVVDVQKNRREFVGFALAIPDVSVLDGFCDDLWELLPRRDKRAAGFRPRGAVVDVAIEGALDIAARLRERVQTLEGARATGDLVLGIEVFHIARNGNNIPVLSTSRVEPRAEMIDEYRRVREQLRDPLFRRTRLLNLVAGRPWYAGFDRLLATVPHDTQGIGSPGFRHDARRSFEAAGQAREEQVTMNGEQEGSATESVEEMVYQLVGRYVSRRTEGKTGLSWEEVKSRGDAAKNEYNEARAKVAKDAFLAVRSRTGADFIDYFAGTLCSVPHHLRSAQFVTLTRALRAETDKVRTLTLLALSAHG